MEQLLDFQDDLDFIQQSDAEFNLPKDSEIKTTYKPVKASKEARIKAAYIDYLSYGSVGKQFDTYEMFKEFYLSHNLI